MSHSMSLFTENLIRTSKGILKSCFFPAWWKTAVPFLLLRLILSFFAALIVWNNSPVSPWIGHPIFESYPYTTRDWGDFSRLLIDPWNRWDTGWYIKIAALGYGLEDHSIGFQPFYPFLVRLLAPFVGYNYLFAAIFLSTLCAFAAVIFLYRIAYEEHRSSSEALTSVHFLLAFPSAFFLFTGYTESLFLLLSLGTWYFARRKSWGWAGLFAGLATLTRTQGIALIFLILWMVIDTAVSFPARTPLHEFIGTIRSTLSRSGIKKIIVNAPIIAWIAVLTPAIVIIEQNAILYFTDFGSITKAYGNWMVLTTPWQGVFELIRKLFAGDLAFVDWIDLCLLLLFIILWIAGLFSLRPAFLLYMAATLGLILMRAGDETGFLTGFMRYMMTTFPVFIQLPKFVTGNWTRFFVLLIFFVSQLILCFLFIHWSWIA